jgi:hypothetical protein
MFILKEVTSETRICINRLFIFQGQNLEAKAGTVEADAKAKAGTVEAKLGQGFEVISNTICPFVKMMW